MTGIFIVGGLGFGSPGRASDIPAPAHPEAVIAAGSGVNLGITRLLAKAFVEENQTITIDIPGSIGTKGAIKAVTDGAITLGLVSRPLKEEEKNLGLVEHPYARVAIIVGAHSSVQEDTITTRQLIEIFKGTRTTWKDGNPIIVQAREKSDSGFLVLQAALPGFREVYTESHDAKRWTLYFNDQDANRALSNTPYAIGVTDLGMVATEHLRVKALKLDGIAPDMERVRNGTYPLSRTLSFIYRPELLPDEAKRFLGFVSTEAGKKILQENGYLPLP
ncbi:MAG: substrate-binding domain-containing protein [Desulfobacteraceae bacterium]|nr:substrate-binding domain-containing protein [Desulfobacteraceae bacterium]